MTEEDPDINLTAPDPSLETGIDLWQVDSAEKKVSKASGSDMIELTLSRIRRRSDKIRDRIMLAGGGYDMGRSKLRAFVDPAFNGKLSALIAALKDVKVWANTEVTSFEGRSKLEVKPKDGLPCGGYMRWADGGEPPAGFVPAPSGLGMSLEEIDRTPF